MLSPRRRIEIQMASSSLTDLYRALSRLTSPLTTMNTGAHPDDEQSGMLAYLSLGLGMRVVIGCSTRGEGGQNVLGPERLGALGVMRTLEMQEAARVLDADIHWIGHGPDDPVHDFGFSKDGDGTFAHWGEERVIERMVRAYRMERPDIVIPTFLDVPGQHGHHRAMTRAAEAALDLAASETAYPEHFEEGLKPWRVAKYYLPAWSGGGGTYDDALPPPPATLHLEATGVDFVTGLAFDRIGECSRYYHASQGMGHWPDRPKTHWPLHLLHGPAGSTEEGSILDHLPISLPDLCIGFDHEPALSSRLSAADLFLQSAIDAFPDCKLIQRHLIAAAKAVSSAQAEASDSFLLEHGHRLDRKLREIDCALFETIPAIETAYADKSTLKPGGAARISVQQPLNTDHPVSFGVETPQGVSASDAIVGDTGLQFDLTAKANAPLSPQYPPVWSSLGGNGPIFLQAKARFDHHEAVTLFDLETPLNIAPASSVSIQPDAILLRRGHSATVHDIEVSITGDNGDIAFAAPHGWGMEAAGDHWQLRPPSDVMPGLHTLTPTIDGKPAFNSIGFDYPHIGKGRHIRSEVLHVLALDLELPVGAKVGYVGGGADNVGLWLQRMGVDVTELDASSLSGDLSAFSTIVIGTFAFGTRPDLAAATAKLHQFVEHGGHLVTLYHRPSDGWTPETTPPRRLKIGTPSLRWRVTDPAAPVHVLAPDHPLLIGPNAIGPDDWEGWNKERGLYFASEWDACYTPLLSLHDEGEAPLLGALVSGQIGKGRHTHTSLVLHHQMDKLVPGAFRLMANLLQPA